MPPTWGVHCEIEGLPFELSDYQHLEIGRRHWDTADWWDWSASLLLVRNTMRGTTALIEWACICKRDMCRTLRMKMPPEKHQYYGFELLVEDKLLDSVLLSLNVTEIV